MSVGKPEFEWDVFLNPCTPAKREQESHAWELMRAGNILIPRAGENFHQLLNFESVQNWWECMRIDESWRSNASCNSHQYYIFQYKLWSIRDFLKVQHDSLTIENVLYLCQNNTHPHRAGRLRPFIARAPILRISVVIPISRYLLTQQINAWLLKDPAESEFSSAFGIKNGCMVTHA
jgi:hypothetical protein